MERTYQQRIEVAGKDSKEDIFVRHVHDMCGMRRLNFNEFHLLFLSLVRIQLCGSELAGMLFGVQASFVTKKTTCSIFCLVNPLEPNHVLEEGSFSLNFLI